MKTRTIKLDHNLRDQLLRFEKKGLIYSIAKFGKGGGTKERRWYPVPQANPIHLTSADIAKLSPAVRAQLGIQSAVGNRQSAGKQAKDTERLFKVSWHSPKLNRRVSIPELIPASSKTGAIAEAKVLIGMAGLKRRKAALPVNFIARQVKRNPKSNQGKKNVFGLGSRKARIARKKRKASILSAKVAVLEAKERLKAARRKNAKGKGQRVKGKKKNLHPLEVGANVAVILGGIPAIKHLVSKKKKKAKRPSARAAGKRLAERRHGHVSGRTKTTHRVVKNAKGKGQSAKHGSGKSAVASSSKKNSNTTALKKIRQDFLGRGNTGRVLKLYTPPGSPKDVAAMAKLTLIKLANGKEQKFANGSAWIGGIKRGDWRRMVIGLKQPITMPNGLDADKAHDFGEVKLIEYRARKPHLYGENSPEYPFYHKLGDEGGRRPHLILLNGCLAFRGGGYGIQREGIRN